VSRGVNYNLSLIQLPWVFVYIRNLLHSSKRQKKKKISSKTSQRNELFPLSLSLSLLSACDTLVVVLFFILPNLEPANASFLDMSRCRQYPPTLVFLLVLAHTHIYAYNRLPAHKQKKKILFFFFAYNEREKEEEEKK
jgi:hypothetical protein